MNAEHTARAETQYKGVSGDVLIPNSFSAILKRVRLFNHLSPPVFSLINNLNQGIQVCETTEFRESYNRRSSDPDVLDYFSTDLWTYRGRADDPQWVDVEPGAYSFESWG